MYTDEAKKLGVMSIGFLLENKDDAVVWRGPKKNGESSYCRPEYSVSIVSRRSVFVPYRLLVQWNLTNLTLNGT